MRKIEAFYQNLCHDYSIVEQILEAQKSGIIKSYFLTTLSAMNARRDTDFCLWCDAIWSVHHRCEHAPNYNCRFSFGEDDDGMAFVKVTKEGLKPMEVQHVNEEEPRSNVDDVFDEMPGPILSTKQGQIPLSEDNQGNNIQISVFDNNNEIQVDGISSSRNHHLVEEVHEFRDETGNDFIEGIQQPNAHNMFDELPIPTFIKEMDKASKTTEVESIQGDYELESAIQKVQDDHFTHKQLCAKLCTLEGSHLRDLVIIFTNRMRFSTILGSVFNGCQLSEKLPHQVDESSGNSYFECPCSRVSFKSLITLNTNHSISFIDNVLSPLMLSDVDWFMDSSLSRILGVQANNTRVFESVVNRKTFLTLKELYSGGIHSLYCHWAWLELPLGAENFLARLGRAYNSSDYLTSCIFIYDPGDLLFSATSSGLGFCSIYNSRAYMIVDHFGDLHTFDPRGNVNSSCGCKLWQVGQLQLLLLSDSMLCSIIALHDLVKDKFHAFISLPKWNTRPLLSTLEDKGDFKGEENKVYVKYTCQLFSFLVFHHNYISSRINKSVMFLISIFNPSSLSWLCELWDDHLHKFSTLSVLGLVLFVDKVVIFVLNEQCSTTIWLLPFIFLSYSRIVIELLCLTLTLTLEENGEYKRGGVYGSSSYNEAAIVCFKEYIKSVSFIFGSGDVLNHCHIRLTTAIFLSCVLAQLNLLQSSDCSDNEVAILVFDPGGYGNGQKVMEQPKACQYGGGKRLKNKRSEDHQIYVFDPGGLMIRLINAMVTNSQLGMYYAMSCFKHCLSLILEDKDRFKRRILIHTEI